MPRSLPRANARRKAAPGRSRPYRLALDTLEDRAVPATWTNPAGGSFHVAGNWSGGVPGSTAEARFNLTDSGTVTLGGTSRTVGTLVLNHLVGDVNFVDGTVRLDPGGATLTTGTLIAGDTRESSSLSTKFAGGQLF